MSDKIDMWFLDPEGLDDRTFLEQHVGLLSDEELAKGNRIRLPRLRRDFLLTRVLVRTILSERLSLPIRVLSFDATRYGRPYLRACPELSFNVSHTDGLIMLAIAPAGSIGVDIERLGTNRATRQLAEHCFAEREIEALRATGSEQFDEAFFSYWTLKESYVKARGTGLSTSLDSFEFNLKESRRIDFAPPPDVVDDAETRFWLFRPRSSHLCAICVRQSSLAFELNAWEIVPLTSQRAIELVMVRCTSHRDAA